MMFVSKIAGCGDVIVVGREERNGGKRTATKRGVGSDVRREGRPCGRVCGHVVQKSVSEEGRAVERSVRTRY